MAVAFSPLTPQTPEPGLVCIFRLSVHNIAVGFFVLLWRSSYPRARTQTHTNKRKRAPEVFAGPLWPWSPPHTDRDSGHRTQR